LENQFHRLIPSSQFAVSQGEVIGSSEASFHSAGREDVKIISVGQVGIIRYAAITESLSHFNNLPNNQR
jgi:hypothetical protein